MHHHTPSDHSRSIVPPLTNRSAKPDRSQQRPDTDISLLKAPRLSALHHEDQAPPPSSESGHDFQDHPSLRNSIAALNRKIVVGHIGVLSTIGAVTYAGGAGLLHSHSMITTAAVALLGTASVVIRYIGSKNEIDKLSSTPPSHHHEHIHRVREILRPLCERYNIPEPHIVIAPDQDANASMLDRPRGKDILTLTDTLLQTLNDRELRGVIAHELAHQNRWHSRVRELTSLVSTLTQPIATSGITILAVSALAPTTGGIIASTLGFAMSVVATTAAAVVTFLWCNYVTRHNEIKTDLRACAMTGDPEALITVLSKIESSSPDFQKIRGILARLGVLSHPLWEERAKHIRRAFGTSA